jgi:hypothetical protein
MGKDNPGASSLRNSPETLQRRFARVFVQAEPRWRQVQNDTVATVPSYGLDRSIFASNLC